MLTLALVILHGARRFTLAGFFLFILPLVVLFFALGQADFKFDPATHIMQVDRYQGEARAFDLADQLHDFFGIQQ